MECTNQREAAGWRPGDHPNTGVGWQPGRYPRKINFGVSLDGHRLLPTVNSRKKRLDEAHVSR